MTAQPEWSPVEDFTADLLSLVAMGSPSTCGAEEEWALYVSALKCCAGPFGAPIKPNDLRPLLRDHVAPRRIGAFTHRALHRGLVEYTGEWEISDDTEGRNGGKPCRIMRWIAGEL